MHVMCMCIVFHHITVYELSKTDTHICNALVSYPITSNFFSAGSAKVIAMTMKMRGIVRGVANGSTEMAQGVNENQG